MMTPAPFHGRAAFVTGASRGIGAATARRFAEGGAAVALAARDEEALQQVQRAIESDGGQVISTVTDVTDEASVRAAVESTLENFGRLDFAFNNAGDGHRPAPLADLSLEDFERAVRVNLQGVFLSLKWEIAAMLASGGGAIVNMSSEAGVSGVRGMGGYAAAKHGIIGLTRVAALDYADRNVRVNAIAPGPIRTHRVDALPEAYQERMTSSVPIGRLGTPDDVAHLVTWLCSDAAAFITGVTVPIDGGRLAGSWGKGA